jgi:hypothetical protein
LNVPEHDRLDVFPLLLTEGASIVRHYCNATPSLPNPELHEYRTVIRDLIPHGFVLLAVGDLAKRGAIDPGQDPPVDDEVIDELGERVVVAAHRHLLRQCGEIGVGGLAIIEVCPDPVVWLIEPAVEVPQDNERGRPLRGFINPTFQEGIYASSVSQAELVEAFSKHSLLRCTDMS